jgi:hypothetical protein
MTNAYFLRGLCVFARDILTFSYCFAAQSFWSIIADQGQGVSSIDLFSSLG